MYPPEVRVGDDGVAARRAGSSWRRRIWSVVLGLAGGVLGLGLAGAPVLLFAAYIVAFTYTSTPDSGFNVFTLGAIAFIALAAVMALVSVALLFFRVTRPFGIGYLAGVGLVIVATLVVSITSSAAGA